jgi:hypothetical protein
VRRWFSVRLRLHDVTSRKKAVLMAVYFISLRMRSLPEKQDNFLPVFTASTQHNTYEHLSTRILISVHSSKTGMLEIKFDVLNHSSTTAVSYSFSFLLMPLSKICNGCVAFAMLSYFIHLFSLLVQCVLTVSGHLIYIVSYHAHSLPS